MEEFWKQSASTIAIMVKTGEVSACEVVASAIDRIEKVNPHVNAMVSVQADEAFLAARRIDALVANREDPGILAGVPVSIKVTGDIRGQLMHDGLSDTQKGSIAERDSYTVANLRRAGAVFIGRTNAPEFNMRWDTSNPIFGRTLNPWDPTRTPGGSSGGGAAAVATGMCALAHGSDLGGSIRQPADSCGVVTIRPTVGRTPTLGSDPHSSIDSQLMGVDGPLGRSVNDVWLGLNGMVSDGRGEPLAVPVKLEWNPPTRLRVRVITQLDGVSLDPDVTAAVRKAADALAAAGHEVEEAPNLPLRRMAEERNSFVWSTLRHDSSFTEDSASEELQKVWKYMLASTPRVNLGRYIDLLAKRADDMREWDQRMLVDDIYLGPVAAKPSFLSGADSVDYTSFAEILEGLQLLISLVVTGLPVAVVPVGTSKNRVPVGVQLAGPRWREDVCLAAAQTIEDAVGTKTPIDPRDAP